MRTNRPFLLLIDESTRRNDITNSEICPNLSRVFSPSVDPPLIDFFLPLNIYLRAFNLGVLIFLVCSFFGGK